jgi:hypothetical protein
MNCGSNARLNENGGLLRWEGAEGESTIASSKWTSVR